MIREWRWLRNCPWVALSVAVLIACGNRQSVSFDRTAATHQGVTSTVVSGVADTEEEVPPDVELYQGYVLPDSSVDRSQGLTDLAAMRVTLGKPYVGQGVGPPSGGGSAPCSSSNCASPGECIGNACSTPCTETACPFGSVQGSDPSGACFCIPSGPPSSSTTCGWIHAGPTNIPGRVLDLAIDPTNASRLFAATVGGIWRTTDGARTWTRVSDEFLGGKAESVAINPSDPSEVIVGLGDDMNEHPSLTLRPTPIPLFPGNGIWLSPSGSNGDRGSWVHLDIPALSSSVVSHILYSPDGNTVYAATSAGVFIGARSGATFTFPSTASLAYPTDSVVGDFRGSAPLIYAGVRESGTNSGVWKFDGTSWTQKDSGIPADPNYFGRVTLAIAKSNPSVLYAKIAASDLSMAGFFVTKTSAESVGGAAAWTNHPIPTDSSRNPLGPGDSQVALTSATGTVSEEFYNSYNSVVAVDPMNENIVYSGGVNLWKSTNGGTDWGTTSLNAPTDTFSGTVGGNMHADQHAMVFDPTNHAIAFVGNDGGVYKSTDLTNLASFHWLSVAHGMITTEFYDVASQKNTASLIAGGAQDNGTTITFGNHAWYTTPGCDGSNVSVDALNSETIYSNCNGLPVAIMQPIQWDQNGEQQISTGSPDVPFGMGWKMPAGLAISGPIVADPTKAKVAIAAALTTGANQFGAVIKTTDGLNWNPSLAPQLSSFDSGPFDSRHPLAISTTTNSSGKKTYYAAAVGFGVVVNVSEDEGATWSFAGVTGPTGVNGIAVDTSNSEHAVLATSGATGDNVFVSSDGGKTWAQVTDSGPALPTGTVRNVAFDPTNPNVIYVAHQVGVFKGTLSGASVSWTTFDEGLPNGVDVHDIAVDSATNTLIIGTFGYGAYTRNASNTTCQGTRLLVRDNVFDQGQNPSPSGVPDPEHPVGDSPPGFFKANDDPGSEVYFWDSTDIRIDIPSQHTGDPAHQIAQADNVEFETCPVEKGSDTEFCPVGTMVDTNPVRGASANAYVQVANEGLQPSSDVRVITLFVDATVQVPNLPADFWTTTFPPSSTTCGPLNSLTQWHLVGCDVIHGGVGPDYPQVHQFPWTVPANAADHSCMLTIVESAEDPIPSNIRTSLVTETIAHADRHIAQRNMHIISPPSTGQSLTLHLGGYTGLTSVVVPNFTTNEPTRTLLISRSGLGNGRLSFLLPAGMAKNVSSLPAPCGASGTTPPGSSTVTLSLPKDIAAESAALEANGNLLVGDHTVVNAGGGSFGGIANAGPILTSVGIGAQVGNVASASPVILNANSTVNGTVFASSAVQQFQGATVTGGVQSSVALTPVDKLSWNVQLPTGQRTNVDLEPHHTSQIAPGNYGLVSVEQGATLSLSSGTYTIDTLNIASGATVAINTSGGPTYVYLRSNLVDLGTVTETPGLGANDLFVYLGILPVVIPGPFAGTFIAPSALLTLGPNPVSGAFFAQNLTTLPGTTVNATPFLGFASLGACLPLSASEQTTASQLGLDATAVYPVAGNSRQITIPVPVGGQVSLGLRYESGTGPKSTAGRFRVLSLEGATVLGGSTFVVRRP